MTIKTRSEVLAIVLHTYLCREEALQFARRFFNSLSLCAAANINISLIQRTLNASFASALNLQSNYFNRQLQWVLVHHAHLLTRLLIV